MTLIIFNKRDKKITKNGKNFNNHFHRLIVENSTRKLELHEYFNQKLILPNSVNHITFNEDFNKKIIFPNSVKHIDFNESFFNQKIRIPNSVRVLILNDIYIIKILKYQILFLNWKQVVILIKKLYYQL